MKKIKLDIEGMHCSSCAMNIDFAEDVLKQVQKTGYKAAPAQ